MNNIKGSWKTLSLTDERILRIRKSKDQWINLQSIKIANDSSSRINLFGLTFEEFTLIQKLDINTIPDEYESNTK